VVVVWLDFLPATGHKSDGEVRRYKPDCRHHLERRHSSAVGSRDDYIRHVVRCSGRTATGKNSSRRRVVKQT